MVSKQINSEVRIAFPAAYNVMSSSCAATQRCALITCFKLCHCLAHMMHEQSPTRGIDHHDDVIHTIMLNLAGRVLAAEEEEQIEELDQVEEEREPAPRPRRRRRV